jgi:hypothetical protein
MSCIRLPTPKMALHRPAHPQNVEMEHIHLANIDAGLVHIMAALVDGFNVKSVRQSWLLAEAIS